MSRETATKWYRKFREVITKKLNQDQIIFDGEVELDEIYINHLKVFVEGNKYINGIENFWNQAKRHLRNL